MADVNMLVDDALLKELSIETKKIGTKVVVRKSKENPAYTAEIADVIIVPQSEFYRVKFVSFYYSCQYNSVKALKELHKNFPFTPDYNLGIGYILNQRELEDADNVFVKILLKGEFELFERTLPLPEELKESWKKPISGFL